MDCQICTSLSGHRMPKFSKSSSTELLNHAKLHRSQSKIINGSRGGNLPSRCFPTVGKASVISFKSEAKPVLIVNVSMEAKYPARNGAKARKIDKKNTGGRDQNNIQRYCYQLQEKFARKGTITCRECSERILVHSSSMPAIGHAMRMHFQHKPFHCKLCSRSFNYYAGVTAHIRTHHYRSAVGNYLDESSKYEREIVELLTQCYDAMDDGR